MNASVNSMDQLMPQIPAPTTGPDWWQAARRRAATGLELPTPRDEAWKYTSLKPLQRRKFKPADGQMPVSVVRDWCRDEPLVLSLVDGVLQQPEAVQAALPDGMSLVALDDQGGSVDDWARSRLETDWQGPGDALARLNTAQCSQVWLLKVDPEIRVESPIMLEYISVRTADSHPRLLIDLQSGSSLKVVEASSPGAENAFNNVLVQARVGEGAKIEHVCVQQSGESDLLITRWDVRVADAGQYDNLTLDLGGQLVRHDLNIELAGPEAESRLRGVYPLSGRQHVDNHSRVNHAVGDTRSRVEFRGVLGGRSRAVFNAKALIADGADGSDVVQSNGNLLLSEHAEIDTKPELEIYADDVTASHGATVGQLEEEAVFYLQSRGIPQAQARRLMTRGFLQAVTAVPEWLDALAVDQAVAERVGNQ